ncbi:hypothetical protein BX592_1425 [Paraburkholderia rhizosphaerae]|uniref:Uncharacterized protein n=1 Tax=Paraburkholderia rhizosphaerae TaxID=480658 RepID=A0A4R8L4G8_9BURK|nr:hypothetical protein BX592_1425 [Paraburkholderia rhizosphaerae]
MTARIQRLPIGVGRRERLCIYIGENWAAACASAGPLQRVVRMKAVISAASQHHDATDIGPILAEIEAWLRMHHIRATINWFMSIAHVRYLLLPWDDRLASDSFCETLAAAMFAQQFPGDTRNFAAYQLRLGPIAYGQPRMAALVPHAIVSLITVSTRRCHCRIGRIVPMLSVVWNRYVEQFNAETGVLALIEGERLLRVDYDRGRIASLAIEPYSPDRTRAARLDGFRVFPAADTNAPANARLTLPDLAPDDDPRLAYALCGQCR